MPAAEALIDDATGVPYATGAITGERLGEPGPRYWLHCKPIVSLQAVRAYWYGLGDPPVTLQLTQDYQLDDPLRGTIWVRPPFWYGYWGSRPWDYLQADYTPDPTVPPLVGEATAYLLAAWTGYVATGGASAGGGAILRRTVGDITVEYSAPPVADPTGGGLPPQVEQLLTPWRATVGLA